MNPLLASVTQHAINPALELLPRNLDTPQARVMLLATGLQESALTHRYQVLNGGGKGPARGLAQFELGTQESRGGVWGVFLHRASREPLREICRMRDCAYEPRAIWQELEHDDVLAMGLARLLLLTDPKPLPALGDSGGGWDYYLRNWRPGKPKPKKWPGYYAQALEFVQPKERT